MKLAQIAIDDLNIPHLVSSLRSTCCPACASGKRTKWSLCKRCYAALSRATATSLYNPIGGGYEKAMADALRDLGKSEAHVPFPKRTNRPHNERNTKESA